MAVDKENQKVKWYASDVDFAFKKVNSSENGLSSVEAKKRLEEYGENTLPHKKP